LDLCEEFIECMQNQKGFEVRRNGVCKSRIDGHPISKIVQYSTKDMCLRKYLKNNNKKSNPKELTSFNCFAEIQVKWIIDTDH